MGRKKKTDDGTPAAPGPSPAPSVPAGILEAAVLGTIDFETGKPWVKVRFLRAWSSPRGFFRPEDEAKGEHELPENIAESLFAEGVVEVL